MNDPRKQFAGSPTRSYAYDIGFKAGVEAAAKKVQTLIDTHDNLHLESLVRDIRSLTPSPAPTQESKP